MMRGGRWSPCQPDSPRLGGGVYSLFGSPIKWLPSIHRASTLQGTKTGS